MVVPEARQPAARGAGPRRRDTRRAAGAPANTAAPGAASCRRRAERHRAAFGPAPAACVSRWRTKA